MPLLQPLLLNSPLANIAFAVVVFMGFNAYLSMPREQDPEVNFNWVNITTILPGASAADVEKRVSRPLEEAIAKIPDIRFVSSNSRENVSSLLVRFQDLAPRDFDKRMNDLRREVQNRADAELPKEAEDPLVLEITTANGFPTAMVMVVSPADDERLRAQARQIHQDLERMRGVDSVFASGLHDPELQVRFEPTQLAARGLNAAHVADAVSSWFRDTFAGNARVGDTEWLVRVVGQASDPALLGKIPVSAPGHSGDAVPLDTLAQVARGRDKPDQLITQDGHPAVLLAVNKRTKANTLELIERINAYIEAKNRTLAGSGLRITLLDDQTIPTRTAIGVMQSNALQGLALVFLMAWLFLGSRIALLIALGIPFSLAGTFWLLSTLGFTLNISVLLGVVIVLGMLVDDAVVLVEAIYYRMARGTQALQAALQAIAEVGQPVLSSVLTSLAAFLPLMLLPGIVGKFMFVIPAVVSLALVISLLEAFWMMPAHVVALGIDFSRPSRLQAWRGRFLHKVRVRYARLLIRAMRHPWRSLLLLAGLVLFSLLAVGSGMIRMQFFAFDPLRIFYVNVDMPPSSAIDTTLREVQRVEAVLRQQLSPEEVRGIAANAGLKFTETEPLYGPAYGQITVSLNPRIGGMRQTNEVVDGIRPHLSDWPGPGRVTFTELSGGPPAAKPIKVRARGDDLAELRTAAGALKQILASIPGARDVADDEIPGRPELVLQIDPVAVRHSGLDAATLSRLIRLHTDGEIVADLRDAGDKVEVRVKGVQPALEDIAQLLNEPLALPGGGTTTLGALTRMETTSGQGVIKRYNLRRAITVEGDLDQDNPEALDTLEANRRIGTAWAAIAQRFPGVSIDFSGELEDIEESLNAMPMLFSMGVGLIYLILSAQFRSYWQPLMILMTVPMAFTGVVLGLLISGNPLSLYTLYGIIALTGIAVNAAIVLIDAANERLAAGMGLLHAAVYAARRRVIPILITTATTIAGLFSLAAGLGGKSLIWGPMAASLVWGLAVATLLTLFLMPLLFRLVMVRAVHLNPGEAGPAA